MEDSWRSQAPTYKMQGVKAGSNESIGPARAPTQNPNRNPLVEAIMKLKTIDSAFDGLGTCDKGD